MSNRSEPFARLLRGAISSIAAYEGKTNPAIEDDLGEHIGVSGATIQRWKSGTLPSNDRAIEILADAAIHRGFSGREWLQRFLHAARYPFAEKLLDQLCPLGTARPRPPRIYENLPAPTYSQFVMRQVAFSEVIDGLGKRSAAVLLVGLGGNGKTCLAREVATHCLQNNSDSLRFDAVVWVSDKDRPGTTNSSIVLDEIARTLDYPGFTQFEHEEKRREVEQLLKRQRVLVIVDNFETITDGALLAWLLNLPEPSKALITTRAYRREYRRGGWPVDLRGMTDAEAKELIAERVHALKIENLIGDHAHLEPLLAATGGNPKAIEITLGLLKYERRPLQQGIDDLYAARGELFDDLFTRAWALLDDAARCVLMVMTFFPASASSEALAATADVHGFAFDRAVERLSDLSLLDLEQSDLNTASRCLMHPLVRAFAAGKLGEQPDLEQQLRTRWSTYFIDFLNRHAVRNKPAERYWNSLVGSRLTIIDTERANLLSVLKWADHSDQQILLIELMLRIIHWMDRRGLYTQRIDYAYKAAHAADLLSEKGEPARLCDAALLYIDGLGYTLIQQGQIDEAIRAITIGLERARMLDPVSPEVPDAIALGQAFLAWAYLERGSGRQAVEHVKPIQLEGCSTVIQHRVTMISGAIARAQSDYPTAIACFNTAAELAEEYGGEDAAIDDLNQMLGFTYLASGDLEQAKARFNSVLALKERAGTIEAIRATYGLASVAFEEGDRHLANQLARAAQEALTRLNVLHQLHQHLNDFLARIEMGGDAAIDGAV